MAENNDDLREHFSVISFSVLFSEVREKLPRRGHFFQIMSRTERSGIAANIKMLQNVQHHMAAGRVTDLP